MLSSKNMRGKKAIFVDVDGTILKGNSLVMFVKYVYDKKVMNLKDIIKISCYYALYRLNLLKLSNRRIRVNYPRREMEKLVEDCWTNKIKHRIFKKGLELIREYRKKNFMVVLVTAAPCFIVKYIKKYVKADYMICSEILLGKNAIIIKGIAKGREKRRRMLKFAREKNINLEKSVSISNYITDKWMLKTTGKAIVVNPDIRLRRLANKMKWKIMHFKETI